MHWFLTSVVASLAASVAAAPSVNNEDEFTNLFIGLHPEDHDHFERTLYDISNPHHKRYGKHLSGEEARALLQPGAGATEDIKRWLLEEHDVRETHIKDRGSYIQARVPVHQAKSLSKRSSAGFDQVPDHIRRHISHIQRMSPQSTGSNNKNRKRFMGNAPTRHESTNSFVTRTDDGFDPDPDLEVCKTTLTPACIFKIYNMDPPPTEPDSKTLYSVPGFSGQTAQHDELDQFVEQFAPYAAGANFSEAYANGGENPQGEYPSGEANLDIQYAVAMSFNTSVEYLAVGGEYRDFIPDLDLFDPAEAWVEPFLELTTHLLDLPSTELPQVVSISYGVNEQLIPLSYANAVCDQIGQLGLRGVSVITSAGNTGPGKSCMSNDGKNTTQFMPGFPKTCPYITSVGGTVGNSPEVAYNLSAGGFSNYWKRPEWQDDVVENWLDEHGDEFKKYYNASGRAYPDVAALADGYQIINHDLVETTGAMISLINNARFKKGNPPMGFLNPWIYSTGQVGFNDITEGRSVGCEGVSYWGLPSPIVPNAGFDAVEGWDPITGFGTPDFGKLKKLACK